MKSNWSMLRLGLSMDHVLFWEIIPRKCSKPRSNRAKAGQSVHAQMNSGFPERDAHNHCNAVFVYVK